MDHLNILIMSKAVIITLTVDAYKLYKKDNTKWQINDKCTLMDNISNTTPVPPDEFLPTDVYLGKSVQWLGQCKIDDPNVNSGYNIGIDSIVYPSLFGTKTLHGKGGCVTVNVKDNTASTLVGNTPEEYSINFTIYPPDNGSPKAFSVDPKLQANN